MSSTVQKNVAFKVGQEEFGLPIEQVISIEKAQEFTQLPNMPEHIRGVINLRGQIIPVIDLRIHLLGQITSEDEDVNRIIVVKEKETQVGLLVDAATDVLDISVDMIQQVTMNTGEKRTKPIKIAKLENRLLILLDTRDLLLDKELSQTLHNLQKTM